MEVSLTSQRTSGQALSFRARWSLRRLRCCFAEGGGGLSSLSVVTSGSQSSKASSAWPPASPSEAARFSPGENAAGMPRPSSSSSAADVTTHSEGEGGALAQSVLPASLRLSFSVERVLGFLEAADDKQVRSYLREGCSLGNSTPLPVNSLSAWTLRVCVWCVQASVATTASLLHSYAAATPPPDVAAAAFERASQAASLASTRAALAAAQEVPSSLGRLATPPDLKAAARSAGARAGAQAAFDAGALPLALCYLMLDAFRRMHAPRQRLAVFYIYHRLLQLVTHERISSGGPASGELPGAIESVGLTVFLAPVMQEVGRGSGQVLPSFAKHSFVRRFGDRRRVALARTDRERECGVWTAAPPPGHGGSPR